MPKSVFDKFQSKVKEVGWGGMPVVLYKSATHRISQRIKYFLKTFYFENVLQNKTLAKVCPFKKPAILLLANARSGSSWIGKILSFSPDIAYLREPIMQTLINKLNHEPPLFTSDDERVRKKFKNLAKQSFAGIPPVPDVIKNRPDFFPITRRNRRLMIKEVTPAAADYFAEYYSPKMIVLLRHPAGVTDSFIRMGWLKNNFEGFSFYYGNTMGKAIKAAKMGLFQIILYENIAENPKSEFLRLFDFMEVDKPAEFDTIIEEYCNQKNEEWKPYKTKRTSENEAYKWKKNLDEEVIEAVKKGYLRSGLDYYRDEHYW